MLVASYIKCMFSLLTAIRSEVYSLSQWWLLYRSSFSMFVASGLGMRLVHLLIYMINTYVDHIWMFWCHSHTWLNWYSVWSIKYEGLPARKMTEQISLWRQQELQELKFKSKPWHNFSSVLESTWRLTNFELILLTALKKVFLLQHYTYIRSP